MITNHLISKLIGEYKNLLKIFNITFFRRITLFYRMVFFNRIIYIEIYQFSYTQLSSFSEYCYCFLCCTGSLIIFLIFLYSYCHFSTVLTNSNFCLVKGLCKNAFLFTFIYLWFGKTILQSGDCSLNTVFVVSETKFRHDTARFHFYASHTWESPTHSDAFGRIFCGVIAGNEKGTHPIIITVHVPLQGDLTLITLACCKKWMKSLWISSLLCHIVSRCKINNLHAEFFQIRWIYLH